MPKSAWKLSQSSSSASRSTRSSRRIRPSMSDVVDGDVRRRRSVMRAASRCVIEPPPTHAREQRRHAPLQPSWRAAIGRSSSPTRSRASSPSWCSASSFVHVRCSRPKNVSSTPLPVHRAGLEHRLPPAARERRDLLVRADARSRSRLLNWMTSGISLTLRPELLQVLRAGRGTTPRCAPSR